MFFCNCTKYVIVFLTCNDFPFYTKPLMLTRSGSGGPACLFFNMVILYVILHYRFIGRVYPAAAFADNHIWPPGGSEAGSGGPLISEPDLFWMKSVCTFYSLKQLTLLLHGSHFNHTSFALHTGRITEKVLLRAGCIQIGCQPSNGCSLPANSPGFSSVNSCQPLRLAPEWWL